MAFARRRALEWQGLTPLIALPRLVGLIASLLGAAGVFVWQMGGHIPVVKWLFWSYAEYWAACALFTLSCWGAGDAVIRRVAPGLRASERVVLALAAGLLSFFLAMFAGGLLGLYGPAFFFLLPAVMVLSAGRPFLRFLRRATVHVGGAVRRTAPRLPAILATVFGLCGVAMIYFLVLTPDNIAFDARWYHLPIAEHYAVQGGIRRFPEGWYPGTLPHLASVVYTWAFLLPGSDLFDRVELSAHLEFVIFSWTLASVPVLARACLRSAVRHGLLGNGGPGLPVSSGMASWAALLLFPGIFLYDSSLCCVADHVLAFWAVPVLVAWFAGLRHPGARGGALLAIPMAGALLTKYQGIYLVGFPMVAVGARLLALLSPGQGRRAGARKGVLLHALSALAVGLLLTSPHWLKNWIWYGDPVYPFAHQYFRPHPWTEDGPSLFSRFTAPGTWTPKGSLGERLKETLEALLKFSFHPHDWLFFHGERPVLGSLFTLSLAPLLFLRRTGRVWVVALAAQLGVFLWYWTYHQDRYLQALVPWMAVVVAATMRLTWAASLPARLSLLVALSLQIIWGGDVYFFPTHGVLKSSPVKAGIDLLSTSYRGKFDERRTLFDPIPKLGRFLPRGAKVLLHDLQFHLGLGRMSVSDGVPWQGGINYGRITSPRALYDQLGSYGVTHLAWGDGLGNDTLAGDLVFFAFANRYAGAPHREGNLLLAAMPAAPPPQTSWLGSPAAVFVCLEGYAAGEYQLGDLRVPGAGSRVTPPPRKPARGEGQVRAVVAESEFLAFDPHCHPEVNPVGFVRVGTRKKATELWIRTRRN